MRDIKLFVDEDSNLVDVDVVNGEPVLLDFAEQTGDQRAAVACFISKGTLPGNLDFGISWGQMYTNDSTLIDFSNELQQSVQHATEDLERNYTVADSYNPQIVVNGSELGVIITRS